jgi:hypothetical protein
MSRRATSAELSRVWDQQRIWSRTANDLKKGIDRARLIALTLAIAAAILAVTAVQVDEVASWAGRTLSASAAIAVGIGAVIQRRASTDQIRRWIRARSASEGLKTEVYEYLAEGSRYAHTHNDPDQLLRQQCRSLVGKVTDLERYSLHVTSDGRPLPAVFDLDSYTEHRVNDQIDHYYRPKAADYDRRVRRLRTAGDVLGGIAVVIGALAATFDFTGLTAWVPVVTTIATALVAHIAASRYDHQIVEFLGTARRLEDLRDSRLTTGMSAAIFVDECEAAISVENQAWMARWTNPAEA